jgi:hypothetical protein
MDKPTESNSNLTTPLTKNNLQVRIVCNSDKENLIPDIFLSPSDHSAFASSSPQQFPVFVEMKPLPEEILNPFLSTFNRISRNSETRFSFDSSTDSTEELKKTDSVLTADSLTSELSSISLSNKAKGYKIPSHQEHRVFADITSLHVPEIKIEQTPQLQRERSFTNSNETLATEMERRVTLPTPSRRMKARRNKENKGIGLVQPLLKYKAKGKKRTGFGLRNANNRRSMRI